MAPDLSPSAARVQSALESAGLSLRVRELPASTRTAAEAAAAVGCTVAQIIKSLVFRGTSSGQAILILASGSNRVDEAKVAAAIGEPIQRATPEFVREQTGFAIGGVAPVGHTHPLRTLIDADLFQHTELWAAAGTPHAVFPLTPTELRRLAPEATPLDLRTTM
jgi:prolyl-tRNA editing enzyme YbaK/EbsC (Cys-tRNA(Pro) deacylase)